MPRQLCRLSERCWAGKVWSLGYLRENAAIVKTESPNKLWEQGSQGSWYSLIFMQLDWVETGAKSSPFAKASYAVECRGDQQYMVQNLLEELVKVWNSEGEKVIAWISWKTDRFDQKTYQCHHAVCPGSWGWTLCAELSWWLLRTLRLDLRWKKRALECPRAFSQIQSSWNLYSPFALLSSHTWTVPWWLATAFLRSWAGSGWPFGRGHLWTLCCSMRDLHFHHCGVGWIYGPREMHEANHTYWNRRDSVIAQETSSN